MIRIPRHIQTLQPYIAGKPIDELAREKNLPRIVKLASNENPLGPSPRAMAAVERSLAEVARYVDPSSYHLVHKLAQTHGVRPAQVICGSGVDAILSNCVKAFAGVGDEILTSEGTFIGIYVNVRKHNRTLVTVPLKRYAYDLDALLAAVTPRTRVIYLANPNNPTGTMFTSDEFESFMARVPGDILVIYDEAYVNYVASKSEFPEGLSYRYDNMLTMRTFSKDYGLAGLRIGYCIGPEALIAELYKVKLPFEPNYLAQQAAIAALDDHAFLQKTVALNRRNMVRMRAAFAEMGIPQVYSEANFILLLMPSEQAAHEFNLACLNRGLIVRHVRAFGIPNGIRINTGTDSETTFALQVIEDVWHGLLESSPEAIGKSRG